eukprot:COSAG03_NODE_27322_length_254_cov_0.406452_1_plen_43_part_10
MGEGGGEGECVLVCVQLAVGYMKKEEVVGLPCVVGSQTAQHAA